MKHPWTLAAAPFLLALAACSAGWYRDSADREVYAILEKKRAEILTNPGMFTIEATKNTLRDQLEGAPGAAREPLKLTLASSLQIAAENSRAYQSEKERVYLSALDVTLERYRLGYIPSLSGDVTVTGSGEEASQVSGSVSPSLTKVLGTGARIVANLGVGIFKSLLSSEGVRSLPSNLSLAISQPLLRGAGPSIVEEPLTQAERDVIYAIRGFERFRHEFAVDVATQVYRILQERDTVQNEKANYENAKRVRERNEAHHEAGRLSDVEVGQAKQNELSAHNRWINSEQNLASLIDEFKIFLGLPSELQIDIDNAELEKLQKEGITPVEVAEQPAFLVALKTRFDYQTSQDRVADAQRRVLVAADALQAGLDIVGSYNAKSPENNATKIDLKNSNWSLGFNFDLPVDRLPQRNAYRNTLIALEAERRAASLATDNVRLQIRNELRDLLQSKESYEIQTLAVALAERRVKSSELYLQAGRASTRDLLEAQEALVAARNALTRNLIQYTLSKLALFRDIGALVVDDAGISTNATILESVKSGPK